MMLRTRLPDAFHLLAGLTDLNRADFNY